MTPRPASAVELSLEFRAISEPEPGPLLREVFREYWPGYSRWMTKHPAGWPGIDECRHRLRDCMPELMPVYEELVELVGGSDEAARFLALWSPTPIIRACSQAVCTGYGAPMFVRNYDHAPHLCDGVVLAARWNGVSTHVMTDCLWGALDGVNEAGLVVALAFGGRRAIGPGFGASLIVRYLLQTCTDVREAAAALRRVPVYMPYNFALLDRSGAYATAYAGPDRPTVFDHDPVSTNHQHGVEWPEYARFTHTIERRERLSALVADEREASEVIGAFLAPPLYRDQFRRASGTLYTVAYTPGRMELSLFWPEQHAVISPDDRTPARVLVRYRNG